MPESTIPQVINKEFGLFKYRNEITYILLLGDLTQLIVASGRRGHILQNLFYILHRHFKNILLPTMSRTFIFQEKPSLAYIYIYLYINGFSFSGFLNFLFLVLKTGKTQKLCCGVPVLNQFSIGKLLRRP